MAYSEPCHSKTFSALAARSSFDQLVDVAQAEPICIQRHGPDVAMVLSLEEFHRLTNGARRTVNPTVARLHAESATRWASVYEALAK